MDLDDDEAQVQRLLRETRPRGRRAGAGEDGNEDAPETESESDSEAVEPPKDLHKTANAVTGRHISHREFGRAWDATRHILDLERRSAAVLEHLLFLRGDAAEEEEHPKLASSSVKKATTSDHRSAVKDVSATPLKASTSGNDAKVPASRARGADTPAVKSKKSVIDLSLSSDNDERHRSKHRKDRRESHKRKRDDSAELVEVVIVKKKSEKMDDGKHAHRHKHKGKERAKTPDMISDTDSEDLGENRRKHVKMDGGKTHDRDRRKHKGKERETTPVALSDDDQEFYVNGLTGSIKRTTEMQRHARSLPKKGKEHARSRNTPSDDEDLVGDLQRKRAAAFIDTSAESSTGSTSTTPENKAELATTVAQVEGNNAPIAGSSTTADDAAGPVAAIVEEPVSQLAQVLSMVPDVEAGHAQGLIDKFAQYPNCVEYVIDALFNDNKYPKAPKTQAKPAGSPSKDKGKGKATNSASEELDNQVEMYKDYQKRGEGGGTPSGEYREAAFEYLSNEFPLIPVPFIRTTLARVYWFYVPAHDHLTKELAAAADAKTYVALKVPRRNKGKTVLVESEGLRILTKERNVYHAKLAKDKAVDDEKLALQMKEEEEVKAGHVFECGCCFDDVAISKMIQCPEAHLFCLDCGRRNAENILGNRGTEILCMDQDGCQAAFTAEELAKFMKPPQVLLLDKIRSERAVEAANIEGISYCPHCPYGCVIENPDERLFHCMNEECMKITCRKCQKPDHLPKTCEEYAGDQKTDALHKVEEAMTEALLKRCPKCQTAVLKESGCNKMTCSKCHILFCYICGILIKGYHHFAGQAHYAQAAGQQVGPEDGKCQLWDDGGQREYTAVEAARMAAIAQMREGEAAEAAAKISDEELAKLKLEQPAPQRVPGMPHVHVHRHAHHHHQHHANPYGVVLAAPARPDAAAAGIPAAGPVPANAAGAAAAAAGVGLGAGAGAAAVAMGGWNPYIAGGQGQAGVWPGYYEQIQEMNARVADLRAQGYGAAAIAARRPVHAVPAGAAAPPARLAPVAVVQEDLGRGKRRKKQ